MNVTDAATTICIACHARPVAFADTWLCGGCFARMRGNLAAVAGAYRWIGVVMPQLASGWRTGTMHAAEKSKPPMRLELHDQRERITGTLRGWARRIALEHPGELAGPSDASLEVTVQWMRARLPWCSGQSWVVALATDLRQLRIEAHALAPWQAARTALPTPCGECGRLSLTHYAEDDAATCRNRDCGVVYPWIVYEQLVYTWCNRVTMQARRGRAQGRTVTAVERRLAVALDPDDLDDPATVYLTTDQAAEAAHVASSTVRSWANRGQLRPYYADGDDETPYYLEIDVLDVEAAHRRGRHQLSLLGQALASVQHAKPLIT